MGRILQFFRSPMGRYLLIGLAIFVVGWGVLRGCSNNSSFAHPRYSIAVDRSWYPLALYGKETNLLAFTDDLLEAIAEESGLRFNLIEVGTPNLIPDLDNGTYDAIISSMAPTALNVARYQFSDPVYLIGPVLVARIGSDVKSLAELTNSYIGIPRGASLAFDIPFPKAKIIPYDNMTIALGDLEDNKIDALIMDSMQAYLQIQGIYSGKLKIVTKPLTTEGLRLVSLNNIRTKGLLDIFNKSLLALRENGQYEELLNQWGLFNPLIKELVEGVEP